MRINAAGADSIRINGAGRLMLLLAGCCGVFATYALLPVLPAIATHFARTSGAEALTRLLVSIIGIMVVIGSPISGALADRFGARRTLVTALIVYAIAGCAGGLLNNLYALLATRILVGISTAAEGTASLALLVRYSDGKARNAWLGYITTVGSLLGLVLIPASSYIANLGWRWVFAIYVVTLPLSVLAMRGFPRDEPGTKTAVADKAEISSARQFPLALLAFSLVAGMVMLTPTLYIPFHVRDIGISEPSRIGMAMLPSAVATAMIAVFFGRVRAKLSLETTFALGFGLGAMGLAVAGLAQAYWQILAGVALMGLGYGLVGPNILALASDTGPAVHRAKTMGFARGGLYGGPLLGQVLVEPIAARGSASIVLLVLAVLAATLALVRLGMGMAARPIAGT